MLKGNNKKTNEPERILKLNERVWITSCLLKSFSKRKGKQVGDARLGCLPQMNRVNHSGLTRQTTATAAMLKTKTPIAVCM